MVFAHTTIPLLKSNLNGEVKMGEKREAGEMFFPLRDLGAKVVVAHPW